MVAFAAGLKACSTQKLWAMPQGLKGCSTRNIETSSSVFAGGVDIYVGAENLLDRRYEVGRAPLRGPPAMAKVGLRWNFGDTTPTQ